MNEAAAAVQVARHVLGMDTSPSTTSVSRFRAKSRWIVAYRRDAAFDRRMRDVALVPQRHVLECGTTRAHQARQTRQILGQPPGALVRQSPTSLFVPCERLSASITSRALQMAFSTGAVQRACDDCQRGEIHGMPSRGMICVETGSTDSP